MDNSVILLACVGALSLFVIVATILCWLIMAWNKLAKKSYVYTYYTNSLSYTDVEIRKITSDYKELNKKVALLESRFDKMEKQFKSME